MQCAAGDCVEGLCQALLPLEGACSEGLPSCTGPARCVGGRCALPLDEGQTCAESNACATTLDCNGGLCGSVPEEACVLGEACGSEGLCLGVVDVYCVPLLEAGATCSSDASCAAGLSCLEGQCTPNPGLDEPCANGIGCADGLACRFDGEQAGTCGPLPQKGETCALGMFGPFVCAPGLACAADSFVCDDPPLAGEPCAAPNLCSQADLDGDGQAPDLGCDFRTDGSFCTPLKAEGEPCQNDQVCGEGLYCDFTVCAKAYALGERCSVGNECGRAAACIPDENGVLACRELPEVGERCVFDCAPGGFCKVEASELRCQAPLCRLLFEFH